MASCCDPNSSRSLLKAILDIYKYTPAHSLSSKPALGSRHLSRNLQPCHSFANNAFQLNTRRGFASRAALSNTSNTTSSKSNPISGPSNPRKAKETSVAAGKPVESSEEIPKRPTRKHEPWFVYKQALKKKFPEGWNPRKKISPDAMEGMRALNAQYPEECTREVLANQFKISQEAVRRILRSKPKPEAMQARQRTRWAKRHDQIWDNFSELGLRPKRNKDRSADENTFEQPTLGQSA